MTFLKVNIISLKNVILPRNRQLQLMTVGDHICQFSSKQQPYSQNQQTLHKMQRFLKLFSESQQNSDHQAKKGVCSHLTLFSPIIHACTVHAHMCTYVCVCLFENGSGEKLQKDILFLKFSDTIQKMTLKTYFQE